MRMPFQTSLLAALMLGLFALATLAPQPLRADGAADAAIEQVIADQIAAFQRDDMAAAFAHAAPGIQSKFGSPENFGRMVRQGYPMIYRPSRVEWRGLTRHGSGYRKTVLFEDGVGALFEADYIMALEDGAWRIRGVFLRKLPGMTS
ncbi:MAG: DUF4864 domain-containing protein [Pikeienuella sp.]